jgi:hypothetical protein
LFAAPFLVVVGTGGLRAVFFATRFFVVLGTDAVRAALFVVVDGGAGMASRALLDAVALTFVLGVSCPRDRGL